MHALSLLRNTHHAWPMLCTATWHLQLGATSRWSHCVVDPSKSWLMSYSTQIPRTHQASSSCDAIRASPPSPYAHLHRQRLTIDSHLFQHLRYRFHHLAHRVLPTTDFISPISPFWCRLLPGLHVSTSCHTPHHGMYSTTLVWRCHLRAA